MPKKQKNSKDTTAVKKIKAIPQTHDSHGNLFKLSRADFPYNRNGIIAYCDYRIEYWQVKKQEMLKKADPLSKIRRKREKLMASLDEINAKIEAANGANNASAK